MRVLSKACDRGSPVCQRPVRQSPLAISVLKGGEWCPERAQAIPQFTPSLAMLAIARLPILATSSPARRTERCYLPAHGRYEASRVGSRQTNGVIEATTRRSQPSLVRSWPPRLFYRSAMA